VSEKVKSISELQSAIPQRWTAPPAEFVSDLTLLEAGALCILTRHLSAPAADKTLKALRATYADWNELRVSQVQEYAAHIKTKSASLKRTVAFDLKSYLQEVFQNNHGFDLEFLREDPTEASKFVLQLLHLGASAGHYLLWVAANGEAPASTGMIRVLDRLGVMQRTSSVRKAQERLSVKISAADRAAFGVAFGYVIEHWCDAKKPSCWECVLVDDCRYGRKVYKDWQAQQKRLEQHRKRDEERRKKEEERARKRAEAEAKKRERDEEKRRRADERKRLHQAREREIKKKALAKEAARRRAEVAQKKAEAAAKKQAAARKKAGARQKAAKKKTAKKKVVKKPAKKATKKPTNKAAKKPVKKATKKPVKKATKKPVKKPAKKAAKKPVAKKKKTGRRR